MARWRECRLQWSRFKMDAARWIDPQSIGDPQQLTPRLLSRLLWLHPGLRVMAWFRFGSAARVVGARGIPIFVQRRLLVRFGVELLPGNDVEGGLYIAHPVGCTLVAAHIGENVTVIGPVTFGYRQVVGWPVIGDRSFFGAGARVLGRIEVGEDAVVGANAVVLDDVPDGATVVGMPARPVRTRDQVSASG